MQLPPELTNVALHRCKNRRRAILFNLQGGRCFWCEQPCLSPNKKLPYGRSTPDNTFTVEHLHPKEHGGCNDESNVVGACHRCNHIRNSILKKMVVGKSIDHLLPDNPKLKNFLVASVEEYIRVYTKDATPSYTEVYPT